MRYPTRPSPAKALLGEQQVVDLTTVAGTYYRVAMLLAMSEETVPPGKELPFKPASLSEDRPQQKPCRTHIRRRPRREIASRRAAWPRSAGGGTARDRYRLRRGRTWRARLRSLAPTSPATIRFIEGPRLTDAWRRPLSSGQSAGRRHARARSVGRSRACSSSRCIMCRARSLRRACRSAAAFAAAGQSLCRRTSGARAASIRDGAVPRRNGGAKSRRRRACRFARPHFAAADRSLTYADGANIS